MVETAVSPTRTSIYDQLGVHTIINASGATTAVSGTLMSPEVAEAMVEATKAFVVLDELNAKVGEKIAQVTGAEAGYVTCGSAAAMAIAAAACIAGSDPARIRQLPDSSGMPNEIIIHRVHRIGYDQMFRSGGGKLIEIGLPALTERWELEAVICERTAAVAYIDSPATGANALDFHTVVEIAHQHNLPVIVDAASTLPPVSHLTRWIAWGADLVIYSGGKGIRGPQDSGLLAGRKDLIQAAVLNGNPHRGIGRGMKVSKEAMVGLAVAIDQFMARDHDRDFAEHRKQAEIVLAGLGERRDVRCELVADPEAHPAPIVSVYPVEGRWQPQTVLHALQHGTPGIYGKVEHGALTINTHCLRQGEPEQIVDRINEVLDRTG
jgi:L-seryl-tRNA(Ser) seleniumtransferase